MSLKFEPASEPVHISVKYSKPSTRNQVNEALAKQNVAMDAAAEALAAVPNSLFGRSNSSGVHSNSQRIHSN